MGAFFIIPLVVYGILFVFTVYLMYLSAALLITLTRLVRTLNDYWRLRTAAQYSNSTDEDRTLAEEHT